MQKHQNFLPNSSFVWIKFILNGLSSAIQGSRGNNDVIAYFTNHRGVKLLSTE